MCVIFFYANSNPAPGGFKLILASNRDEFYARDTKKVGKWANAQHVYGGIDLEPGREGGTWLAVGGHSGVYKIGALLNLTGEPKPRNAAGRGMIVSDFVTSCNECSIKDYNTALYKDCEKYSAFNFVSIEIGATTKPACIAILSNVPPTLEIYTEGNCYGFGNSLPNAPFEKVKYGKQHFQTIVEDFYAKLQDDKAGSNRAKLQTELVTELMTLLKHKEKFWPDAELERRAPNWGYELSALNVRIPNEGYGSRTHTVILIDAEDKLHFVEETMNGLDPDGEWSKTHIENELFSRSQ